MEKIIESLGRLDSQIKAAKRNIDVLEGNKEMLMKRLKDEFGLKSVAEANREITSLEKELASLSKSIQEDFETLQSEYAWE
jgi:hypothetical protein